MTDPKLEDHVVGLELQLVELVEQEHRAEVQGLNDEVSKLRPEIEDLQAELALSAEKLSADEHPAEPDQPTLLADPVVELYKSA